MPLRRKQGEWSLLGCIACEMCLYLEESLEVGDWEFSVLSEGLSPAERSAGWHSRSAQEAEAENQQ